MGLDRNKLTNSILGFLIVTSFFLSFSLWTTGRNIGEEESDNDSSSETVSLISHFPEDVFRPNTVAIHGLTEAQPLLVAKSYELKDFFKEKLEQSNLSEIEQVESLTKEEYIERTESGQWLEFVYPEKIPFGIIEQKFLEMPKDKATLFFDRVLFDINSTDLVYFYHTDSGTFYQSILSSQMFVNLDPLLDNEDLTYLAAEPMIWKNKIKYLLTDSFTIDYRTYVIHQLSNSNYISNFFPDTSLVDVRSTVDNTRYIDFTKEVTINEDNHTLTYLRQVYTTADIPPQERYMKSFQQINQFENWIDTFILSSYDEENEKLLFRREIEGVPVFSKKDSESVSEVAIAEEGMTHLKIPLRFANTPITIKGAPKKELVSGIEMIEELRETLSAEELEKIDDFTIGYSWQESEEESQVVNFTPNWHVLYDGDWLTLSSLLELSKEVSYGF